MAIPLQVHKSIKKFDKYFKQKWMDVLERDYIPIIQQMILEDYDTELVGVVSERQSRTNPILYRDEFEQALESFVYIEEGSDSIKFVVPDEDNFPWLQGRLRVIKNVLDGTVGIYVEADEEQFVQMYDKRPISETPYDGSVPRKERIYLLRYTGDVRRREREKLGRSGPLIRYPFSNTPPIDIFTRTNNFVIDNLEQWMKDTIKEGLKEFTP